MEKSELFQSVYRYYFLWKHKNFKKAIDNYGMYISRGCMRDAVKKLELYFNKKLVIAHPNKIVFTKAGDKLGRFSNELYAFTDKIEDIFGDFDKKEISIGILPDFYTHFLAGKIENYLMKNFNLTPNIYTQSMNLINNQLLKGDIEAAILPVDNYNDNHFNYIDICNAQIMLVFKKDNSDMFENTNSLEFLNNLVIAINDKFDPIHDVITRSFLKHKIEPKKMVFASSYNSLLSLVESNNVAAAITGNYPLQSSNLQSININDFFDPLAISIIYRKGETLSPEIMKFLENINPEIKPQSI